MLPGTLPGACDQCPPHRLGHPSLTVLSGSAQHLACSNARTWPEGLAREPSPAPVCMAGPCLLQNQVPDSAAPINAGSLLPCPGLALLPVGREGGTHNLSPHPPAQGLPTGLPPRPGTLWWFSSPSPALPGGSELPLNPTMVQKPTVPARALVEVTLILDGTCPDCAPARVFCGNKVESVWTPGFPSPGLSYPKDAVFASSHRRFQFAPLGSVEVAGGCRCWVGGGGQTKLGGRELAERVNGGAPTHRSRSSLPLSSSRLWLVRAETRSASKGLGHGGGVGKEGGARCSRFQAS